MTTMKTMTTTLALALTTGMLVPQSAEAGEGRLDKDLIRRVVRAHIPEVRACYNQGLERDPKLAGSLTVRFTIGIDGKVTGSAVGKSTLGDKQVQSCIAGVVGTWLFPRPDGGVVTVEYPFVLEPG